MTRSRSLGILMPVLLLVLVVFLAWLQYRWTGEVSRAERERMEAGLSSSIRRFADEVDEEIARIYRTFHVESEEELGEALTEWRSESPYPDLVEDVYFVRREPSRLSLAKLGNGGKLHEARWPVSLSPVHERLANLYPDEESRRTRPLPLPVLTSTPPAIAVPVLAPRERRPGFALLGHTLVTLSVSSLEGHVFPELAERYFASGDELDYDVAVMAGPDHVVFSTPGADVASLSAAPDARGELFSLRRVARRPPRPEPEIPPPPSLPRFSRRGGRDLRSLFREAGRELVEGRFEVVVRHRAGSLEAAVAKSRLRNLAVSFGVMGLLAASVVLIAVSTRRATELNDRKMEFVAGVSHELRTPLAVMRSAGQNLADGSVSEPEHVKRYGSLIEAESQRLNELVEQVLELAGIQSLRRPHARSKVSVVEVVRAALADCEAMLKEKHMDVETAFASDSVYVTGEANALRRAVGNLVANAAKHGGNGPVEVAVDKDGDARARIVVSDRGPGIPKEDLPHLFDAFYRGKRAREGQIPGSGLGLSLVSHIAREHGGRVDVHARPGGGSRFVLLLPAVEN